ncbi:hypothetical protein [uncultured Methylobacterium sp.]|uniref:hypothetical protein n=1 Tax=uncultured Methylobacterium sp. TaxID=157278 RepID=UPI0035C95AE5
MLPVSVIERLFKVDPNTARLLIIGLALVAVAAIATSWQVNIATAGLMGLYVAVLGLVAAIFANILQDPFLRKLLGTFFAILLMFIITMFVVSALLPSQKFIKPTYCLVKFWENCDEVERRITQENSGAIDARVSIPGKIVPPADTSAAIVPSAYQVDIQFAGLITRESIMALNNGLRSGGWNVRGPSGERIQSAAGLNEVRYGVDADRTAAQALADAVTATRIGAVPVQIKRVPVISASKLELWISN